MADTAAAAAPAAKEEGGRGGFGRGGRGRGGGRGGRPPRAPREGADSKDWTPCTKLGRLVKAGKVKSLEEIFLYSLPVKEFQIIDAFLGESLKDEVMKIMPVQKQTAAGQRTRFKAFIAVGDSNGHIGLGVKCAAEVATAIRGAIIMAKISVVPVRRGWWGVHTGAPHTVPVKVTGSCGSVRIRLIPAPRGTGLVASVAVKKILALAGIEDVYTSTRGHTKTKGNFIQATYNALKSTYGYLTPDHWGASVLGRTPIHENSDFLSKSQKQKN